MWLPYTEGSIVSVLEPDVTEESVIAAQVVMVVPAAFVMV